MAKSRPVKTFRIGFVKAAIWEGDGGHYNTTFGRAYKQEDQWKDGDSFSHSDLLNLAKVAARAEQWIAEQVSE